MNPSVLRLAQPRGASWLRSSSSSRRKSVERKTATIETGGKIVRAARTAFGDGTREELEIGARPLYLAIAASTC